MTDTVEPKEKKWGMSWDGRITPAFLMTGAQFVAVAFAAGAMWTTNERDMQETKTEIVSLKAEQARIVGRMQEEIRPLREQATSIAVINRDIAHIREGVTRLENALQQMQTQRRTEIPSIGQR